MNRHTDAPRPPPAAALEQNTGASAYPPDAARLAEAQDGTGIKARLRNRSPDSVAAIGAAAALIALAMEESQAPVDELGSALARMTQTLSGLATGLKSTTGGGTGELQRCHDLFARDLGACIESLQFHDRLLQQLTQVRNLLANLAANTLPTGAPGDLQSWQVLLENLRTRFTSDSHRILFNLLLPVSGGRVSAPALHANEGSIELF
jgi:hypothetical protein